LAYEETEADPHEVLVHAALHAVSVTGPLENNDGSMILFSTTPDAFLKLTRMAT